jgi:hypothetical protein
MAAIPPWWHYDEPGHFEYVWLVANRSLLPKAGEYDPSMRIEMAKSMAKYGWYDVRNYHPDLTRGDTIYIGVPQAGNPPGYYWAASVPLWFLKRADITIQYDAVRVFSIVLFLLILYLAWLTLAELLPSGHPLQWMVPLSMALLPGFVDVMFSVSDDVSAVLAFSFFLLACARLIKRGHSLTNLILIFLSLLTCFLTKNTAWIAFLIVPFVMLSVYAHKYLTGWTTAAVVSILGLILAGFTFNQPAGWYQNPVNPTPLRVQNLQAPLGNYVLQLGPGSSFVGQLLSPSQTNDLRGLTLTIGAWMWANQNTSAYAPAMTFFSTGNVLQAETQQKTESKLIQLTTQPTFVTATLMIPNDIYRAMIVLPIPTGLTNDAKIYYGALALVIGPHSNVPPQFSGPDGQEGIWDGQHFNNLIRNGSAESAWLSLKPWVDQVVGRFLPSFYRPPSIIVYSLQDPQGSGWYYSITSQKLFRTFWDQLAGMKAVLPGNDLSYRLLEILTWLATFGFAVSVWRRWRGLHAGFIILFGFSLFLAWTLTLLRGATSLTYGLFVPLARYAFPVIVPTMFVLCAGWIKIARLLGHWPKIPMAAWAAIFINLMVILDSTAVFGALQYFHPILRYNVFAVAFVVLELLVMFLFFYGYKQAVASLSEVNQ